MDVRADRVKCPTCKTIVARRQLSNHQGNGTCLKALHLRRFALLGIDQLRLGNGWGECHPTKRLNDRASMVQARNRLSAYPGPMCVYHCVVGLVCFSITRSEKAAHEHFGSILRLFHVAAQNPCFLITFPIQTRVVFRWILSNWFQTILQ